MAVAWAPQVGAQTAAEQASELLDAGRAAVAAGEYDFAIQAFRQAHALTHDDTLLFRVDDAARQRSLLRPQVNDAPKRATRLSVSSNTLGASVRIDGGKARKLPLFVELEPGRHQLQLSAKGYITEVRAFGLRRDSVLPLSITLDPEPARLAIDGPIEAVVHIDGEFVTTLPADPIRLSPGKHSVMVRMNGHHVRTQQVMLERGKLLEIDVELERTEQRKAAIGLIVGGLGGIAAGIVFGVFSVIKHREAQDVLSSDSDGILSAEDTALREDALATRDDYRVGSGVTAGVGLTMFLAGGAMFVLDAPPGPSAPGDVAVLPLLGPGFTGGMLTANF